MHVPEAGSTTGCWIHSPSRLGRFPYHGVQVDGNLGPKTLGPFVQGVGTNCIPLHYKATPFLRIILGFMIQGGDIVRGDGKGSESIYGGTFPDENFNVLLLWPILDLIDSNGSQFYITTIKTSRLDEDHVLFGRVIQFQTSRQVDIMQSRGLSVIVETVNILFDCLCRDLMLSESACLLECSGKLGWDADVFCYNTLMSRLCDAGEYGRVLKLLVHLLKKGIWQDVFSFTIAIWSLCGPEKFQVAKCLLDSQGIEHDDVAFNTLSHGFCFSFDGRFF